VYLDVKKCVHKRTFFAPTLKANISFYLTPKVPLSPWRPFKMDFG